ncbi:MAG TPA: protein-disulfide reductase DsbD domain-containing protein [Porticoccaceae bacterium]|nr:protein-disulfide reductase DsbD domain-containing protein [Porticoccaceae bacterium]
MSLLTLLAALESRAEDPFGRAKPGSSLLAQPEFLPVEEAYRLRASVRDGRLALAWDIAPGYYLYRDQFQIGVAAAGQQRPLAFSVVAGDARRIYDDYYEKELEVFYAGVELAVELSAADPPAAAAGSQTLAVISQGCADAGLCYPPQTQYLAVDLDAATVREVAAPPPASPPPGVGPTLPTLLGFALLGGLILNLMPCVFPVLSIKVMSLTAAHANRGQVVAHGLAYALGVVLSFLAIAVALIALRGAGLAVGWGFQLQSPGFVTALAYLFFILALGFAGQLPWSFGLGRFGNANAGKGLGGSLLTGVLATVVASPCTAPFMGTALGVALTQAMPVALGIFAALGLGMALPFLVLTWAPALLDRLPAPGPWMETVRQALAFPLYGTALWLLWVLGHQTDIDQVLVAALGMLVVALALWLAARRPRPVRIAAMAVLLAGLALPALWVPERPGDRVWEPFAQARLDQLRAAGVPVFVNLTADWCITCLANERIALSSPRFRAALAQGGIRYLKGDWTRYDPEITALLRAHGRSGVPLYLFFRPHQEAQILPQLLTEQTVLEAVDAAPPPRG